MMDKKVETRRFVERLKTIRPYEALGKCLAGKYGYDIDTYLAIMHYVEDGKIMNNDFQSMFVSYYFGNSRTEKTLEWRKEYFKIFDDALKAFRDNFISKYASYDYLLKKVSNIQDRRYVEKSLTSKMVHSIHSRTPIIDEHVCQFLDFRVDDADYEQKLHNVIEEYGCVSDAYRFFLDIPEGKICIEAFDEWLPDYAGRISDFKKLDYLIWGM
jgi:hypothetical protein